MTTADATVTDQAGDDSGESSWDGAWPVKWLEVRRLVLAFVVVTGIGVLVGMVMTDWAAPNAVTRLDDQVASAFADNRTAFLNDLAPRAAGPADTFVKIGISAVICGLVLWRFRRWDEAVYVALPLVFEATSFVTITSIVQRPRPDVERLLESTINSSFPSGHVAAATVYAAVVVVIWRHNRSTVVRGLSAGIYVVIVIAVAWARLYQGMHYLSDVIGGIVLGATTLVVTDRILDTSRMRPADEPISTRPSAVSTA